MRSTAAAAGAATPAEDKRITLAVFPANGRVGIATLKALTRYPLLAAQSHFSVLAICRSEHGPEAIKAELDAGCLVEYRVGGDLESVEATAKALQGVDVVFLSAPLCEDSHVLLENGVRAAAQAKCRHVLLHSVSGYAQTKDSTPAYLMANRFRKAEAVLEELCAAPPEVRALMFGLDGAGKTHLLKRLKSSSASVSTIPTVGFETETVALRSASLAITDVGGQRAGRALWPHFVVNADLLVFVLDAADKKRVKEAREALLGLLRAPEVSSATPLLVLCNKQDVDGAMGAKEVADRLGLKELRGRKMWVQPCSGKTGTGVLEGLEEGAAPVLVSKRLSRGMDFTHVRASYFMDNLLASRGSVVNKGVLFGCYGRGGRLPLVSLADYGALSYSCTWGG